MFWTPELSPHCLEERNLRTQSARYVYNYTQIAELSKVCSCFRSRFWLCPNRARGLLIIGNFLEYSLRSKVSLVIRPVPKSSPMQVWNCTEDECLYPVSCRARLATTAIGIVRLSERNRNVNWVRAYGYTCLKLMVPVGPYRYVRYVTIIESRPTPFFQALYWTKLCTRGNKTVFPSSMSYPNLILS